MNINFYCPFHDALDHKPYPIGKIMPEWYKKLPPFFNRQRNDRTVRVCLPFADAMSSGYCIPLPMDLKLTKKEKGFSYDFGMINTQFGETHSNLEIGFDLHAKQQAEGMPIPPGHFDIVCKIIVPWIVTTPPGYSCLFTPPMNRFR